MIFGHLYPFNKKKYIKGDRPKVACILCSIVKHENAVENLTIYQNEFITISLNLFPYNPGHLMIFPNRCLTDIREMSEDEEREITKWTKKMLDILDSIYSPRGYNIGYNMKDSSGASIPHIHQHIIPRYANELGIAELIGGAKILIENPKETLEKLQAAVKALS